MENKIELNPQTKVIYEQDWKPHYKFGGYDISLEDEEKLNWIMTSNCRSIENGVIRHENSIPQGTKRRMRIETY